MSDDLDDFLFKVSRICQETDEETEADDYSLLLNRVNNAIQDTTIDSKPNNRRVEDFGKSYDRRQIHDEIHNESHNLHASYNIPAKYCNIPKVKYDPEISSLDQTIGIAHATQASGNTFYWEGMSLSSRQYMQKYNLLNDEDTTRFLDIETIKNLPKLK